MSYRALYRLYRPQTFDEVVGQKYIIQTIKNAIKDGRLAHAYLLTGPRGTGKTTIAKLIAKGVNCTANEGKPCGECENCKAIANGTHPDVIEIDAASNNSVDEVRELIEKVKYAPIQGKYKVYIIDEVHMMTSSAFNALLKTLEEPPENVIFILATTEVHKVLPTIVSRCQRFDFGRISQVDIEKRIKEVLKQENIAYEDKVPSLVATLADGGVRDALGILDQTIAYAGNNLTEQHVRDIYGVVSTLDAISFIKTCYSEQIDEALNKINEFDQKGVDLVRLTNLLINIFKDVVVYNKTKNDKVLQTLSNEQAQELGKNISSTLALDYIDVLMEASAAYKRINSPKSYFELAVLKLCHCEKKEDIVHEVKVIEKVVEKVVEVPVKKEETKIEQPKIEPQVVVQPQIQQPKEQTIQEIKHDVNKYQEVPLSSLDENQVPEREYINYMLHATKEDKQYVLNRWNLISRYVQKPNFAKAAGLLMDGGPLAVGPNCIVISYDFKPRAEAINRKENYFIIKDFLTELLGSEYSFLGIDDEEYKIIKLHFINQKTTNTLPEKEEIKDRFVRETVEEKEEPKENNEGLEAAKSIFGDMLNSGE